jgi:hypothetical protein
MLRWMSHVIDCCGRFFASRRAALMRLIGSSFGRALFNVDPGQESAI